MFRFAAQFSSSPFSVYAGRAWARLSCTLQAAVAQSVINRSPGVSPLPASSGREEAPTPVHVVASPPPLPSSLPSALPKGDQPLQGAMPPVHPGNLALCRTGTSPSVPISFFPLSSSFHHIQHLQQEQHQQDQQQQHRQPVHQRASCQHVPAIFQQRRVHSVLAAPTPTSLRGEAIALLDRIARQLQCDRGDSSCAVPESDDVRSCAPAARVVPSALTALVGSFSFSFVHVSNSLISSLSVALSSSSFPEVKTSQLPLPKDVLFPPLAPRTRKTQLFWRAKIDHVAGVGSPSALPVTPVESSCAFPVVPASLPSSRPPVFTSIGSVSSFTGPLRFFSCPVSSPEGLHCPRGSFIHAPFCRFHLREKLGLDITPSTIPSAGFGLFTLSARAKGDHLVEYMGEVLSGAEVESRYPKGDVGVYYLAISSNSLIDSALFRGVGSFANASKGKNKPKFFSLVGDNRSNGSCHVSIGAEAPPNQPLSGNRLG